jgi:hypothetical protein
MNGSSRTGERLLALFLLGALAFTPPLLSIFNDATRILGVPALYFYLFACWAALILLVALTVERRDVADDTPVPGHDSGAPAAPGPPQEPRDA